MPHTWSGRLIFRQHSGILTLRLKHFHISAAVGFGGVLCWVSIIHEAWPPFTSCHRADHWIPSGPWGTSPGSIREAVRWARWHGNSQGSSHLPKPRPPTPQSSLPSLHLCPSEVGSLSAGSEGGGWGGCALIQALENSRPPLLMLEPTHGSVDALSHKVKATFGLKSERRINSLGFALNCPNYQHIKRRQKQKSCAQKIYQNVNDLYKEGPTQMIYSRYMSILSQ